MSIFNIKCVEVSLVDGREVELCIGDEVRMLHTKDNRVPKYLDGEWATVVGFTASRSIVATERSDLDLGLRKLSSDRHVTEVRHK